MNRMLRNACRTLAALSGTVMSAALLNLTASAEEAASGTAAQPATGSQMLLGLLPFAIALLLLYLIMIRPQQKREKEAQKMRENVRVGDEICTAGGLVGIVIRVTDDTVVLETGGERSKIRVKKWAIHENITQMEEVQQAERERKAARRGGIATAAADDGGSKKKKDSEE